MYYRVGFPFWRALAKRGVKLKLTVQIMRDDDAGVFIATSKDLRGLCCEAKTLDELVIDVQHGIEGLMSFYLNNEAPTNMPVADMRICAA